MKRNHQAAVHTIMLMSVHLGRQSRSASLYLDDLTELAEPKLERNRFLDNVILPSRGRRRWRKPW